MSKIVIKAEPTAEELAKCAKTEYVQADVPLTEEQKRNREQALVRCMQLKGEAMRDFPLGDAVMSGAYEVP